jgi:hypothetical protein
MPFFYLREVLMNRLELINKYNKIALKHKHKKSKLSDLTDGELFVWIACKTLAFGRNLKDSLSNAETHLKNRVNAEKVFSQKEKELL